MKCKNDRYTYRVTWSDDDDEYVGLCAEFPALSWLAPSAEGALKGIRHVIAKVASDMGKNGETLPQPFSYQNYTGKFIVRVPPEVHRKLSIQAAEAGVSLNRLASVKLAQ